MSNLATPFTASTGTAPAPESLQALLARRRPGYSLEAPLYLRDDVFQADLDIIFRRHWIFVGVAAQAAEPGDYFTVEIGGDSVLVVRGDDEQLRAFHNVCRHRGARLSTDRQGSVGNIVCSYHQWTYNVEGRLIHVDHMGDHFERDRHNLKPVHLKNLEGLVFICLADEAPDDFEEMAAQMRPYLAPHQLEQCKVAAQIDLVEHGNWKITMENNRECYHCVSNHPELTVSLYEHGFGYQPGPQNAEGMARFEKVVEESTARWEAMGLPSARLVELDTRITGFRTQRLPLDRAGESQTMNTEVACKKLLGDLSEKSLGGLSFWTQPNSWHHLMSDHVVSISVIPLGPDRTMLRTFWLVHRDAVEGVDYKVDELTKVWHNTNEQDRRLVETTQAGVRSPAYEPGPYSPFTEGLVEAFCNWYVGRMRAALDPAR